ncbi:MAG TPA: polyhydroxyalkanoic acid system family protein [Usitatibacter sp.]|jgi:putative polyhydroxyalkanoate system protein|nr:polyhydroxyalkanoic acid system family protein [Usitatibacter sp.]
MADIDVHRVHGLGLAAARRAAEQMAADLGRKFDVRASWQGDTLRFERPGASGFVTLGEKDLRLSLSLGFLLKAMKPSIEKLIHEELDNLFKQPPRPAPATPRTATPRKAAKRPKRGG